MNVPRSTDSAQSAPSVGNNEDGQVADNLRSGMSGEGRISSGHSPVNASAARLRNVDICSPRLEVQSRRIGHPSPARHSLPPAKRPFHKALGPLP